MTGPNGPGVPKLSLGRLSTSACAQIVKKFSVRLTGYLPRFVKVRVEMVTVAIVLSSRRCSSVRIGTGTPGRRGFAFQKPGFRSRPMKEAKNDERIAIKYSTSWRPVLWRQVVSRRAEPHDRGPGSAHRRIDGNGWTRSAGTDPGGWSCHRCRSGHGNHAAPAHTLGNAGPRCCPGTRCRPGTHLLPCGAACL